MNTDDLDDIAAEAQRNLELLKDEDNLFGIPADATERLKEIEDMAGVTRIRSSGDARLILFHIPNLEGRRDELGVFLPGSWPMVLIASRPS